MRVNDYLSVLMCQLNITLDCNNVDEYLIETECAKEQIENAFKVIESKQPDITLFPEISYKESLDETYKKFSEKGRIIVAGSYYKNGINNTVVFQNEVKHEIQKGYASGAEPMARKISNMPPEEFLKTELQKREFHVNGKRYIFLIAWSITIWHIMLLEILSTKTIFLGFLQFVQIRIHTFLKKKQQ